MYGSRQLGVLMLSLALPSYRTLFTGYVDHSYAHNTADTIKHP